jgi:FkbH-like protein
MNGNGIRERYEAGDLAGAWIELLRVASETNDYSAFLGLTRWRRKLLAASTRPPARRMVRLALLGGASTEMLEAPLALALDAIGLEPCIQRADYNTFAAEMLDPASATAKFRPDVAVLVTTSANLPSWPAPGDDLERVRGLVTEVADYWLGLCSRLHDHVACEIVLDNFHPQPIRSLGSHAPKSPWDANTFIRRVNLALGDRAPAYVHIHDVEGLAGQFGVRQWFDSRFWFHAKQPVSFACLVPYVKSVARVVGALFGGTAKCLILDLDNTLWGGVIGDDGPEGIRIGEGDPVGEAFRAVQKYVLELKQRGILLAVCSKNDEAQALRAFTERTDMLLKRDDFVAFRANWRPKPENIASIAAELNIGLDSLVFLDDNPVEREHVRRLLPEVRVVELSDDPADYPLLLDDAGHFETTAISLEDRERSLQYQASAERTRLLESTADYAAYLRTLDQRAVIRAWEDMHVDRITQLINKSNQFNLTTLRLTRSQVEELMRREDALTVFVRLKDRFGDNGLISVFAALLEDDSYRIDLWLMSCRVLGRGVEQLLTNHVAERARARGASRLLGIYRPTARNGLVERHFESLGFDFLGNGEGGATRWSLDLSRFTPFDVAISSGGDY